MSVIDKLRNRYIATKQVFTENNFPNELIILIGELVLHLKYELFIDIKNKSRLPDLFAYIKDRTSFHHVKFNGLAYYERPNCREHEIPKKRPVHDQCDEYECSSGEECEGSEASIYPTKHDKLKYMIDIPQTILDDEEIYTDFSFIKNLSQIDPRRILLIGYKTLMVRNASGSTTDHRGQNHCKVLLEQSDVTKNHFISLRSLIDIYYKVKCNKWDQWYELYCRTNVQIKDGTIIADLIFDHGS